MILLLYYLNLQKYLYGTRFTEKQHVGKDNNFNTIYDRSLNDVKRSGRFVNTNVVKHYPDFNDSLTRKQLSSNFWQKPRLYTKYFGDRRRMGVYITKSFIPSMKDSFLRRYYKTIP